MPPFTVPAPPVNATATSFLDWPAVRSTTTVAGVNPVAVNVTT